MASWRDHRGLACGEERREYPGIGIKRFVGDQRIRRHRQQMIRAHQVVGFAAGQEEADWVAQRVDQSVDLGAQSTARAPIAWSSPAFF